MSKQNNYEDKIRAFAEVLGLGSPNPSGDSLKMCCPFHDDEHPSFGINISEGMYNCFACKTSGHFSRLAQDLRGHISPEYIEDIEGFKILTKIDTLGRYEEKPSDKDIARIKSNLRYGNISRVTIEDFISFLLRGCSVCPSGANSNKEWQQQQCVMLDFDNKDSNFTMEEVLDYASTINKTPTFAYHTFSHTEEKPKFRFVYCFKEPITEKEQIQAIIIKLLKLFKEYAPDMACKDLSRLFLGTNKGNVGDIFTSNFIYTGTRFSMAQLEEVQSIIGVNNTGSSGKDKYLGKVKFQHDLLAKDLIQEYHIIKLNSLPYFYDKEEGIYVEGLNSGAIEDILVQKHSSLNIKQRLEVIENIKHSLGKNKEHCDYHYVGFQNGVLYLDTLELMPFSPDIIITSKLTVNYVPHLSDSNEEVDNFFNAICLNNKNMIVCMYRIIGVSSCATNKFHKTFVLYRTDGRKPAKANSLTLLRL